MSFCPFTSIHEFKKLIEATQISRHIGIIAYRTPFIINLAIAVHGVSRRQEQYPRRRLRFRRDVHLHTIWGFL